MLIMSMFYKLHTGFMLPPLNRIQYSIYRYNIVQIIHYVLCHQTSAVHKKRAGRHPDKYRYHPIGYGTCVSVSYGMIDRACRKSPSL